MISISRGLANHIRKNPILTRLIFKVWIGGGDRIHWDMTSLILRKCLAERIKPGSDVLEVGTGPFSILSLYLYRITGCRITASDINPAHVARAARVAAKNGIPLELLQSDLFENIAGKYDTIFFNSVYIPKDIGLKMGIDRIHPFSTDWCGGESGSEIIEKFLCDAGGYLKAEGEILLGFNTRYLAEKDIRNLCQLYQYEIKSVVASRLNPSVVLVLERRP